MLKIYNHQNEITTASKNDTVLQLQLQLHHPKTKNDHCTKVQCKGANGAERGTGSWTPPMQFGCLLGTHGCTFAGLCNSFVYLSRTPPNPPYTPHSPKIAAPAGPPLHPAAPLSTCIRGDVAI